MHSIDHRLALTLVVATACQGAWEPLAPGLELGQFTAKNPTQIGDSRITVLRIDPDRWELVLIGQSLRLIKRPGRNR